jgi:hypothetical protein
MSKNGSVGKGIKLKDESPGHRSFISVTLGPGVHSASNRKEYQKQKNVSRKKSTAGA